MAIAQTPGRWRGIGKRITFCAVGLLGWCIPAHAEIIETDLPDLTIRWDNTFTENLLVRTARAPSVFLKSANNDDTDRNIPNGLAAARTDVYSELDVKYADYGFRASAAGWFDQVYAHNNRNNSPSTLNSEVVNNRTWQRDTQQLVGYRLEVGDLFTYGAFSPTPDQRVSYRIGQFAQLWGESLYLATNGISYGMNPIDGIKAQLLLNAQARDVYMSTPQVSVTYQPIAPVSLSFYYKLGYRQTRAAPVGSYFSATDTLDIGGDRIYTVLPPPLGAPAYLRRGQDIKPNGLDGQFGISARYNFGDYTVGLYALRYDETTPQIIYPHPFSAATIGRGLGNYIGRALGSGVPQSQIPQLIGGYFATNPIGSYQVVYPKAIQLYGASFAGNLYDLYNIGAEISARHNTDLVSVIQFAAPNASNGDNAGYAVGDTLHGQVSLVYASPPVPEIGADQVTVTAEVGFNQLLAVTQNKAALAPGVSHFASLGNLVVSAAYYSVRQGLDLAPSIGIAGQLVNTSAVDSSERAHTGTISLGLKATLNQRYNILVQYRHYMGYESKTNPTLDNLLLGRDFVGFTLSTVI